MISYLERLTKRIWSHQFDESKILINIKKFMRIYNSTKRLIEIPLGNNQKLSIGSKMLSQNFMPTSSLLKLLVSVFTDKEIAIVVGGAWEGNMCAEVPAIQPLCVSSVDEALARFVPKTEEKKEEKEEVKKEVSNEPDETVVMPKPEEPKQEQESEVSTEPKPESEEQPKKKVVRKTRSTGKVTTRKKASKKTEE